MPVCAVHEDRAQSTISSSAIPNDITHVVRIKRDAYQEGHKAPPTPKSRVKCTHSPVQGVATMLKLISLIVLVLVATFQNALALPELNEPRATALAGEDVANAPLRRWVSFLPDGLYNGPAAFNAHDENHPDVRRRQGSANITTSVPASQASDAYGELPTLVPVRTDLDDALSSLDSSLDAQVTSANQEMTTGQCVGVPDVNGTPVTLCGPTAASAPPGPSSSSQHSAAKRHMAVGGLAMGIAGALVL